MSFDLSRALEDLAETGASRRTTDDDALTARVGLMASRIRRRRAARYAGTVTVAACAVGALALGIANLPGVLPDGTGPATSPDPVPGMTLDPIDPAQVCGLALTDLEAQGLLAHYAESAERTTPTTADAGFAEVMGVSEDADGAAVELEYFVPSGAELSELGWTVLVVDAEGVVVGALETGLGPAVSPPGATSTGTTTTLPTTSCAGDEPLEGRLSVVGVAEAHGVRDGVPFLERVASEPYPLELGGIEETPDPFGGLFTCNAPGPESIHTLPDAGGLTLAADLPAAPWEPGAQIVGTVGAADGATILANVSAGVTVALVDPDGLVAGFLVPDTVDVELLEAGDEPATVSAGSSLATCDPDGQLVGSDEVTIDGTYTAWPFVTAVLKEVVTAEGEAFTPPSEPVIVVANPVELAFSG